MNQDILQVSSVWLPWQAGFAWLLLYMKAADRCTCCRPYSAPIVSLQWLIHCQQLSIHATVCGISLAGLSYCLKARGDGLRKASLNSLCCYFPCATFSGLGMPAEPIETATTQTKALQTGVEGIFMCLPAVNHCLTSFWLLNTNWDCPQGRAALMVWTSIHDGIWFDHPCQRALETKEVELICPFNALWRHALSLIFYSHLFSSFLYLDTHIKAKYCCIRARLPTCPSACLPT